jgi:large subunit ribosomal protein L17
MRKRKKGRKFGRKRDQRKSLLKSLLREFFLREKITTTKAKAKEIATLAQKLITLAKEDSLHTKRLLARKFSKDIVKKLVKEIGPRYKERKGGYTRIIKLGQRKSNGAEMAIIELVK